MGIHDPADQKVGGGWLWRIASLPWRVLRSKIVRDNRFVIVRRIETRIVVDWLKPKPGERILDVACGMGVWSRMVRRAGAEYFGEDLSLKDVAKARKRFPDCCFVNTAAETLCFKEMVFDKVFSNCAIEHFDDDERAFSNMYQVLKQSGIAVVTADSLSRSGPSQRLKKKHCVDFDVRRYYTHDLLMNKLNKAGFEVITYRYYLSSWVADLFYALGIRFGMNGWVLALFPVSYPLTLFFDAFSRRDRHGCGVAVLARKR